MGAVPALRCAQLVVPVSCSPTGHCGRTSGSASRKRTCWPSPASNEWVGLDNYRYIFNNRTFQLVLRNTLIFIVACVGFTMLFGLLVALLLNQKLRGRTAVRAIVFAPTLLSGAAIGIVWAYIFDPRFGLLAQILDWLWIPSPQWLEPARVGAAGRHHRLRLEKPRFRGGDLPRRPAGYPARPLRRRQDRRCQRLVAVQIRHHPDALADLVLPVHHLDSGHIPGVRHHPGHDRRRPCLRQHHPRLLRLRPGFRAGSQLRPGCGGRNRAVPLHAGRNHSSRCDSPRRRCTTMDNASLAARSGLAGSRATLA